MKKARSHSFQELLLWGESRNQVLGLVTLGIATLSSFMVVAALSVYQFGLYQLILTAVGFASIFASGFFDDLIINEVALSFADGRRSTAKRLFNEYFWGKVAISLIATVALFFGAELVARYYDKDISSYIQIASFLVAIGIIRTSQSLFFRSIVSFSAFGANAIYEAVRLVALAAFWFTANLSLTTVLGVSVVAAFIALLYSSIFFILRYREAFRGIRADRAWLSPKIIFTHGKWLMLRQGVSRMATGLDAWYVRFFLNTEAVGFYAFARTLLTILQGLIPTSMFGALLPWESGQDGRLQFIYRKMTKYGIWIGLALAMVAFLAIPPFIEAAFPKYVPAMPLFRYIVWTLPLYAVYKFQKSFLVMLREQELLAKRYLTEVLVNTGIAVTLLPTIGLFAIAVQFFTDYIGRVWLYAYYLRKRYPYLSLSPRGFIRFDEEDRRVLLRILEEIFSPDRWFRRARSRVEIPR